MSCPCKLVVNVDLEHLSKIQEVLTRTFRSGVPLVISSVSLVNTSKSKKTQTPLSKPISLERFDKSFTEDKVGLVNLQPCLSVADSKGPVPMDALGPPLALVRDPVLEPVQEVDLDPDSDDDPNLWEEESESDADSQVDEDPVQSSK